MSWQIFKQNILNVANNPNSINDVDVVANAYATEYDSAVKRGTDFINLVSVKSGNVSGMRSLLRAALLKGQSSDSSGFSLITEFGNAVISYWTGAQLNEFPIPAIPAVGAVQNISVISNLVLNPGTWPGAPAIPPTQNTVPFVDLFISTAISHLATVSGVINGNSLYPTAPTPTPGPSIINWTGYTIPPSLPGGGIDYKIPEQIIEARIEELEEVKAKHEANPDETSDQYIGLLTEEINSGYYNSAPPPSGRTFAKIERQYEEDPYAKTCGELIIQYAIADLGILETGTNAGAPKNYGGKRKDALGPEGELPANLAGRIDEMFRVGKTTLDNFKRFQNTGDGYWWCAAATSTWWVEAGFPVPPVGSAGCPNWVNWGKTNGWWIGPDETPQPGAAVLYFQMPDHPNGSHIGIVEFVDSTGVVHTIEGNASGGGFTRNGVGVFRKIANRSRILGFVNPPCELQSQG